MASLDELRDRYKKEMPREVSPDTAYELVDVAGLYPSAQLDALADAAKEMGWAEDCEVAFRRGSFVLRKGGVDYRLPFWKGDDDRTKIVVPEATPEVAACLAEAPFKPFLETFVPETSLEPPSPASLHTHPTGVGPARPPSFSVSREVENWASSKEWDVGTDLDTAIRSMVPDSAWPTGETEVVCWFADDGGEEYVLRCGGVEAVVEVVYGQDVVTVTLPPFSAATRC